MAMLAKVKSGICTIREPAGCHMKSTNAPSAIASHARNLRAKSPIQTAGTSGEIYAAPTKPSVATAIRTLFSVLLDINEFEFREIFREAYIDLGE